MAPVTKSCSSGAGIDVFDGIRAGRLQQISIDVDGECSRIEKVERSRLQIDGKEVSFESLDLHPPPERRVLAVCIDRRQAQYEARRPGNGRALGESISCPSVGVLYGICQHEIEEDEGRHSHESQRCAASRKLVEDRGAPIRVMSRFCHGRQYKRHMWQCRHPIF